MPVTASRKAAADLAALSLISEAAQAFLTLLTPAIGFLRQNPRDSTAAIPIRDSLHGLSTCVAVMRRLLGTKTAAEAESIFEELCRDLADSASSLDSCDDVNNIIRPLLASKTRTAYQDFVAGNDAAFDIARDELRSAIAMGAS